MPMLKALLNIISLGVLDFCPVADSNVKATALKTHKTCTGCKAVKPLDGFSKAKRGKLGRKSKCKNCKNAYQEKRRAKPEVKAAKKAHDKARRATPEGKAYQKKINDERKADPARNAARLKQQREYDTSKRATDEGLVQSRSEIRIRTAKRVIGFTWGPLGQNLPRGPKGGPDSTFNLLGIVSYAFYVVYLKGMFCDGMEWATAQIDHIRPLSSFDLNDPKQRIMAFHYTNTQLLTAEDNKKKGDKWTEATYPKEWNGAKWVLKDNWELKDENDKYGLNKYHKVAPDAKRRRLS